MQMLPLPLFMALSALMMFAFGLMIANLQHLRWSRRAISPAPLRRLYGSITTLLGIGIGMTIGQDYDGTLLPFATGFFLCTLAALGVVAGGGKGPAVSSRTIWRCRRGLAKKRPIQNCHTPRRRSIQYAAVSRLYHRRLGILDRPPEPVIGRPFGRPVGGR